MRGMFSSSCIQITRNQTGNLYRHVKTKHPELVYKIKLKKEELQSERKEGQKEQKQAENKEYREKKKKEKKEEDWEE
ncbi:hypothetical protein ACLKA6_011621 [Drosophila palustris]